jgi:tetratricopeptide (TPR) repeat protein
MGDPQPTVPRRLIPSGSVRVAWSAAILCAAILSSHTLAAGVEQRSSPATPTPDPKQRFVVALRQLMEGLAGAYGDEKPRVWSAIDSMQAALVEWDQAIREYESSLAAQATNAAQRGELGTIYLDRRRVEAALRELAAASELEPKRADFHTLRGLAYNLLNRPAEATQEFRRASVLDPDDPRTSYRLAQHLVKTGEGHEAETALQQFRESQQRRLAEPPGGPRSPATFVRADLLRQAPGVAPIFPPASYVSAFTSLRQGQYEQAIARFKEAAAVDPFTSGVSDDGMRQASAALRNGDSGSAIRYLAAAVATAPDVAEVHRAFGMAYWADEQYDKSADQFKAAIQLRPDDERSRIALSDVFVATGRLPDAERLLKETIELIADSGQAHYRLGRLYDRQLRWAEAVHELLQAADLNPLVGLDYLYQTILRIYLAEPDFEGAIEAGRNRIDVNPNNAEAHRGLAEIYLQQGRHDDALTEFLAALLVGPQDGESYTGISQVYLRSGRFAEAVEASRRALAIDPAQKAARYALATSLIRLGRASEGAKALEEFQRMQAESQVREQREWELKMLKQEASVSLDKGDYDTTMALLQKALSYEPNAASAHTNLGLILMKVGRHDEAIRYLNKAVDLQAGPEVHRYLAEAYAALGQREPSQQQQTIYDRQRQQRLAKSGWNR